MRFSLRHLLLVFPAFFIGVIVANFLRDSRLESKLKPHSVWLEERINVQSNTFQILLAHEDRTEPVPVEVIDAWLTDAQGEGENLARNYRDIVRTDSWGNPYRIVRLEENADLPFGFYSTGRDGISESAGNDPDDLNSWDKSLPDFYIREVNEQKRLSLAIQGFLFAPVAYLGLLVVTWMIRLPAKSPCIPNVE